MISLQPRSLADVPVASLSDRPTTALRTGTWKYVQPIYQDRTPPCIARCPAGNDISGLLALVAAGRIGEAAVLLRTANPLPSTLGRVCPHPCESECNRASLGGAISVHGLERFLGDWGLRSGVLIEPEPRSDKRVAVIGGGPAGIAAAYHLALRGHAVEVFDDKPLPGGYLRTGIPDYRLPKDILDAELALVEAAGVVFRMGVRVPHDVALDELREWFDAVIIAVGMHGTRTLGVPGDDHPGVFKGVELLEAILAGARPALPDRLAIVGGGNTAMDVARSVLRLGVTPIVVYRRTRAEMPAIAGEVDEALAEGVELRLLTAPVRVVVEAGGVIGLECLSMRLGEPDASGRRRPEPVPGTEHVLPVGGVVTAIGETAELDFLPPPLRANGSIAVDARFATRQPGVFAAGDAATGEGTVTAAVGGGRRVAAVVDSYLRGHFLPDAALRPRDLPEREFDRSDVVGADRLNAAYIPPSPRPPERALEPALRTATFDEVVGGFSLDEAIAEARRCILCGTCNECCNCMHFCPDVAIQRAAGGGFEIDYDHCKGCGICVEECPRGAMDLVTAG
jgi:NADPH-dependent glutamate synthase beta subunit-like oxidoreductase